MSERIVECVPNISEGRDRRRIDEIVNAAGEVAGVEVLDVDPGAQTNRTVITLVGAPGAIEEAAFRLIARAAQLIDMSEHKGAHARHGATDVCPFVPVSGVTMEECVEIARSLGRRVGEELRIPVYLYDQAAMLPERRSLARVRQGEYEALPEKLRDPRWAPDCGPAEFDARAGVVTIGAREFLIAYNVNLNSRHKEHAADIAFEIREKGRAVRTAQKTPYYSSGKLLKYYPSQSVWPCGVCFENQGSLEALLDHTRREHDRDLAEELTFFGREVHDLEGKNVMKPGSFRECRAVGWVIPEYGRAQVSINLTNHRVTSMHDVTEECRRLATARGLAVTGSEIVGVVPYDAIRESGEHYLRCQGASRGVPVSDVVETAIQSLGLRDIAGFEARKSVLGLPSTGGPLTSMAVNELADEVSRSTPAPGGGSIAALAGALGAALASMVANLTHAKPAHHEDREEMEGIAREAQALKDDLLRGVNEDTEAFNEVLAAMRLPRSSDEEKAARAAAIEEGYKSATRVPLKSAESCLAALRLASRAAGKGLPASITDAGVAALMAHAGLEGAIYNVRINLGSIHDKPWVNETRSRLASMLEEANTVATEVRTRVQQGIE